MKDGFKGIILRVRPAEQLKLRKMAVIGLMPDLERELSDIISRGVSMAEVLMYSRILRLGVPQCKRVRVTVNLERCARAEKDIGRAGQIRFEFGL
jgi:hypothetical protein